MADIAGAAWSYRVALETHAKTVERVEHAQAALNDAMRAELAARIEASNALVALGTAAETGALPIQAVSDG